MTFELTLLLDSGTTVLIQVSPDAPMSTLALIIHSETSIPPSQQDVRHNGLPLRTTGTVSDAGLSSGDLITASRKTSATSATTPTRPAQQTNGAMSFLQSNPALLNRIREINPDLHRRILQGDSSALPLLRELFGIPGGDAASGGAGSVGTGAGSFVDPMSADAQRAIEERIRQENVMQNMETAMEVNPESFGSVVMLFVDCKVNSVDGVKAFVDSGAQATIISKECAERCNILRLLDARFAGMAHGVGTAKIYGRIHFALLTLGSEVFEVSFTVMDAVGGEYDMLLGLDMLRKHRASIDLASDCLRIGTTRVPFLAEKDIPKRMLAGTKERMEQQARREAATGAPVSTGQASGERVARSAQRSVGSGVDQGAVSRLVEMGFQRAEVEEALRDSNGNAERAAAILTGKRYGF
eukprot:GFKZ01010501.1.p1 GENE.GFKZ01010501.1~~GFKZ01010501.1.p1  ORF type:complete len:412 (-),score=49.93 GFKZ01010501.1:802-2037(-)